MILNHVMSADIASGIFQDLINYSKMYSDQGWDVVVSKSPIDGASVYHYHRPHLEKKLLRNSVVTVHHDLKDDDKWHLFSNFENQYRQAKKIICLNSLQLKFLKEKKIKNTEIIPHGYNEKIFHAVEKKYKERVNVGIVSRRYGRKVKGEALLYDLLKRLDRDRVSFTFVGRDRTQDCWKARDLGFNAQVFERLPYKAFNSLYESLDALLITSLYEGGPANVPEAISTGTPLIAKKVGMVADYLLPNSGIFLSGDPDEDSFKINEYARDKAFQEKIKAGAYLNINNALTWQEVTKKQFQIYSQIAG